LHHLTVLFVGLTLLVSKKNELVAV